MSTSFRPRQDYFLFNEANNRAFAEPVRPAKFPQTQLRFWNQQWADRIGLGAVSESDKVRLFARFEPALGLQPSPLAMKYHGHQFRHYNSQLGDGRGFLFGQCEEPFDHRLLDFGTKGSGQTPYSRSGDGRLTLKGAVREALATEMLEAHGVNTSKTFCFFETGEPLMRNDEPSPTRSAVLTRLSHGHIRYGTFQRLAVLGEKENMRELVNYCVRSYFPELLESAPGEIHFAMLERIVANAADLAASWMIAGFVHGVLNTDNLNITGESFDYGPWRFLPHYDPAFTAAYFDHEGLYSYSRQPEAVYWNLDQLARSLHVMVPEGRESVWHDRFVAILQKYPALFQTRLIERFMSRLGLRLKADEAYGEALFVASFSFLAETKIPFEEFFYQWYGGKLGLYEDSVRSLYGDDKADALAETFKSGFMAGHIERLGTTDTILQSDYYRRGKPETMLIDEVEAIWRDIDERDDWKRFNEKRNSIRARGRVHFTDS